MAEPRLPNPSSIPLQTPNPDRSIGSYQPGAIGQAEGQAGQIDQQTGANLQRAGTQIEAITDSISTSAATQQFIAKKLELDQAAQDDPNYQTLPDRYAAGMKQALEDASSSIPLATSRADFQDRMSRYAEQGINQVRGVAHGKSVDADRAYVTGMYNDTIDQLARAPDDTTRALLANSFDNTVNSYIAKGSLSQMEGDRLLRQSVVDSSVARAQVLGGTNPTAGVALLLGQHPMTPGADPQHSTLVQQAADKYGVDGDTLNRTMMMESGGKADIAPNPNSGARGLFQFSGPTAAQYGVNPTDPQSSADGAAHFMADNTVGLRQSLGREPTPFEISFAHQQGVAGTTALIQNPNRNAVAVLTDVYGDTPKGRQRALNSVTWNGGSASMSAGTFTQGVADKFDSFAPTSPSGLQPAAPGQGDVIVPPSMRDSGGSSNGGLSPPAVQPGGSPGEVQFQKTGTWVDAIPIAKRVEMIDRFSNMAAAAASKQESQARAALVDQERIRTMAKNAQADASTAAMHNVVSDIAGVGKNPNITAQEIADPDGPYKDLTPDDVIKATDYWRSTKTFGEAEATRQREIYENGLKDASTAAMRTAVSDISGAGDNPGVTPRELADPNGPYKDLSPEDAIKASDLFRSSKTFGEQEVARQRTVYENGLKDAQSAAEVATMNDIYGIGANPGVKGDDIRKGVGPYSVLTPEAREKYGKMADDSTPKPPALNPNELGPATPNVLARVWGGDAGADPNHRGPSGSINDLRQVMPLAGQDNGLTAKGVNRVADEIAAAKADPATAQMKLSFYRNAASQIGVSDPTGRAKFQGFMQQTLEQYDQGKASGLTPSQMLDPQSKDYIGRAMTSFQRPMAQRLADEANVKPRGVDLTTQDGLSAALRNNQITREQAEQLGIQNGWIAKPQDGNGVVFPPLAQ